jgi:hypothetical protein
MVANMKTVSLLTLLFLTLLAITPAIAIQSTTQYSKIFLTPFYNNGMTQNVDYNYTVNIASPDGMNTISSAILTLDAWISPTRIFNAWMNGKQCNTANYTISTTYASAGRGVVTFDCSNAIKMNQINTVTYRVSGGNIGASTSWIDLVYQNNPLADIEVHGTEYIFGQTSKVWIQLLNNSGSYISNGVCFTDIYNPDGTELLERATMTNMNHDGIYYYDIVLPEIEGVYPVIVLCYYTAGQIYNYATSINMINGTITAGDITRTQVLDASYLTTDETIAGLGNPRRYWSELNFTNGSICSNISSLLLQGITIGWVGRWNANPTSDTMNIYIYNYTSASWIQLPNNITGVGTGVKSVSNSFILNNMTSVGFVNSTGSNLRLKFQDTSVADTSTNSFDYDYVYVTCDRLASPVWQDVRGSGEFHLSAPINATIISSQLNYTGRFDSIDNNLTKINSNILSVNNSMNNQFNTLNNSIYGWYIDLKNTMLTINLSTYLNILNIPFNVWTYSARNLTYYPPMNVTVNVTTQNVVVQNVTVNVTTQNITVNLTNQYVTVQNNTVNVTTQNVVVQNVTVNVTTQDVIVQNVTLNTTNIAYDVWNYVGRYIHGTILN